MLTGLLQTLHKTSSVAASFTVDCENAAQQTKVPQTHIAKNSNTQNIIIVKCKQRASQFIQLYNLFQFRFSSNTPGSTYVLHLKKTVFLQNCGNIAFF